ncbi:MAG: lytic transglycosylase domain-containing protein [Acidobacteriota bacterium]|nr:lytic transglycosylase domain-containing protein [Acidobacteriota bacterium]
MRRLGLVLLLAAGPAIAGEYAVLTSGARLHVDRHEANGAKVRLYHAGGMVEMDASLVTGYEADGTAPPSPPEAASAAAPPAPVAASMPVDPLALADAAADRYGLPRALVRSVMAAESGLRPEAVSSKGAIGLMQLMPDTARDYGADPRNPEQNVDAGTRYLRELLEKYDGGLWQALAAYNAGPGSVEKYQGVPPYPETVRYIGTVQRKMEKSARQSAPAPSPGN